MSKRENPTPTPPHASDDAGRERLEKFKQRADEALAPFRALMDEIKAEADALMARMDQEAPGD